MGFVLKVGIVGLPNVGKSTLFNALLKKRVALSANYPFATIEPNVGVVAVPDLRLEVLSELVQREELMNDKPPIVPAVVEFVDIAGLVKGASTGAGLGNQFLSHIREVDAIVHVLRDFADPNVIREGSISPDEDKLTIETELGLADLQTLEKIQNSKFKIQNENSKFKISAIEKIMAVLNAGQRASSVVLTDDEKKTVKELSLLTLKPILYVYNVSEENYAQRVKQSVILVSEATPKAGEAHPESNKERSWTSQDDKAVIISAKLEEEMADLSEEERKEYLHELGIEETGLERLIKKAYKLLGLISFLTAGKKEVRAWTLRAGETALRASGVIHTDFMKGFIRAQVIEYEKLIEAGSYKAAKDKGWIRTEGKDYEVSDGDVVEFLISS